MHSSSLGSGLEATPAGTFMFVVALRTGKIIKNVFERGEHSLQNGILNFVFKSSQSSKIVFQS